MILVISIYTLPGAAICTKMLLVEDKLGGSKLSLSLRKIIKSPESKD